MSESQAQVTHLWRRIQEWLDDQPFEVSQAALGRKLDTLVHDLDPDARRVRPDTITRWKLGEAPHPSSDELHAISKLTGIPYEVVLDDWLRDRGYRGQRSAAVGE